MKLPSSIASLTQRNVDAINKLNEASESERTLGNRVADAVARTVGSWPFIIIQSIVLVAWMGVNVAGWIYQWDDYPFILLNLVLSFQAAYASPIIMMSQNRQNKLSESPQSARSANQPALRTGKHGDAETAAAAVRKVWDSTQWRDVGQSLGAAHLVARGGPPN